MRRNTRNKTTAIVLTAVGLLTLVFGGVSAQAQTAAEPTIILRVGESRLGKIMTDGKGMSLYVFGPDRRNVSNCEGPCLVAWPPVMLPKGATLDAVKLEGTYRRSLLGVAMRFDGSAQVTYAGAPLYYWQFDRKPTDVLGQWVTNNWWVLNEEGVVNAGR